MNPRFNDSCFYQEDIRSSSIWDGFEFDLTSQGLPLNVLLVFFYRSSRDFIALDRDGDLIADMKASVLARDLNPS